MRARLNGRITLGDLSLAECRSLRPFLDTSLYEALNATAPIPHRYVGGLAPLNYSVLRNNKFYDLSQLTSKQIRETRSCLEPVAMFKLGPALNVTETVSWGHSLRKITSTRHKDLILRLIHGELYSKERLHRYRLTDNPNCARCAGIETLSHKYLECPYVRAIWTKVFHLTNKLKTLPNDNEPLTNKIFCTTAPNPIVMMIHAEIILRIKGLRDDQNYLIRPKLLIKNALKMLETRELNVETKSELAQLIRDCDQAWVELKKGRSTIIIKAIKLHFFCFSAELLAGDEAPLLGFRFEPPTWPQPDLEDSPRPDDSLVPPS